jgi:hypothetical protein
MSLETLSLETRSDRMRRLVTQILQSLPEENWVEFLRYSFKHEWKVEMFRMLDIPNRMEHEGYAKRLYDEQIELNGFHIVVDIAMRQGRLPLDPHTDETEMIRTTFYDDVLEGPCFCAYIPRDCAVFGICISRLTK